ncbi:MAG: acireductone synthase [Acidobacteriota bacterium]
MTISLSAQGLRAILLDIEGTTTPMAFVHDVLFPFARAHVSGFLRRRGDTASVRRAVARLEEECAADQAAGAAPPALVLDYVYWLMDRDRKSTGLKALQGLVWQEGFEAGTLRGRVYPDVPPALARWSTRGFEVDIYSSGSVLAQRLLFGTTPVGDLTTFLTRYFDTQIGPKGDPDSYRRIAGEIDMEPAAILFVSDVETELDAAHGAGLHTALCVRSDTDAEAGAEPRATAHAVVRTFDDILD